MARREKPKIYLAGPLGFTAAGRAFHQAEVVTRVVAAGYEPLDPWEVTAAIARAFTLPKGDPRRPVALRRANRSAGKRNAEMIAACDAVLAVLDGADVDSGTAAEIGYAAGLGKPVVGVRLDTRSSGDNEETIVNLQVEWFIRAGGGSIVTTDVDAALRALAKVLGA